MILDKEDQRNLILQLIETSTITGAYLDMVYELKQTVKSAEIKKEMDATGA